MGLSIEEQENMNKEQALEALSQAVKQGKWYPILAQKAGVTRAWNPQTKQYEIIGSGVNAPIKPKSEINNTATVLTTVSQKQFESNPMTIVAKHEAQKQLVEEGQTAKTVATAQVKNVKVETQTVKKTLPVIKTSDLKNPSKTFLNVDGKKIQVNYEIKNGKFFTNTNIPLKNVVVNGTQKNLSFTVLYGNNNATLEEQKNISNNTFPNINKTQNQNRGVLSNEQIEKLENPPWYEKFNPLYYPIAGGILTYNKEKLEEKKIGTLNYLIKNKGDIALTTIHGTGISLLWVIKYANASPNEKIKMIKQLSPSQRKKLAENIAKIKSYMHSIDSAVSSGGLLLSGAATGGASFLAVQSGQALGEYNKTGKISKQTLAELGLTAGLLFVPHIVSGIGEPEVETSFDTGEVVKNGNEFLKIKSPKVKEIKGNYRIRQIGESEQRFSPWLTEDKNIYYTSSGEPIAEMSKVRYGLIKKPGFVIEKPETQVKLFPESGSLISIKKVWKPVEESEPETLLTIERAKAKANLLTREPIYEGASRKIERVINPNQLSKEAAEKWILRGERPSIKTETVFSKSVSKHNLGETQARSVNDLLKIKETPTINRLNENPDISTELLEISKEQKSPKIYTFKPQEEFVNPEEFLDTKEIPSGKLKLLTKTEEEPAIKTVEKLKTKQKVAQELKSETGRKILQAVRGKKISSINTGNFGRIVAGGIWLMSRPAVLGVKNAKRIKAAYKLKKRPSINTGNVGAINKKSVKITPQSLLNLGGVEIGLISSSTSLKTTGKTNTRQKIGIKTNILRRNVKKLRGKLGLKTATKKKLDLLNTPDISVGFGPDEKSVNGGEIEREFVNAESFLGISSSKPQIFLPRKKKKTNQFARKRRITPEDFLKL